MLGIGEQIIVAAPAGGGELGPATKPTIIEKTYNLSLPNAIAAQKKQPSISDVSDEDELIAQRL